MILAGIPAFNEETTIGKIVRDSLSHVDMVVVVDDGSDDATASIAREAGAMVLRHPKNLGIGPTRRDIFYVARKLNAEILVMLDADGQHDARDIPRIISPILNGSTDICIGSRISNEGGIPTYRRFGLRILNTAISLIMGKRIIDTQSGFYAFSKKAINTINFTERGMGLSVEFWYQVISNGLRFCEVPIVINYKNVTGSTYNPITHFVSVIVVILKYSILRVLCKRSDT
jgi:glycosyltransferase involved in cell wall biosynthesis